MATFTVTTASDAVNPAGLSLREALASADVNPGADTIYFAPILNETTSVLTQGELTIASDVTIDGGELQIVIDANNQSRVLNIETGTDVTLDSLHITGGHSTSSGGGILVGAGTSLTVVDTEVVRNSVNGDNLDGVLRGGGIYTGGSLVLRGSTVSDNAISGAAGQGGGIAAADVSLFQSTVAANYAGDAGGIFSGNVTLDASTVHHNTANAPNAVSHGGGIYAGSVTLTNSTVAFNRADSFRPGISIGGGIYAGGVVSLTDSTLTGNYASLSGGAVYAGSVTVANSIIVGNAAEGSYDISGAVTESNGHNLFGSAVSGSLPGDLQNVTAQSVFATVTQVAGTDVVGGVLADNGGRTETVALLDSSTNPALGRGEGIASIGTDQRGEPRPSAGGHPDIGAFELEQSHAIVPGSPGVKLLAGTGEHEALFGLAHGEVLRGGRGNDLLDGGKGADWLRGGPGGDALIGGSGPDRFIFAEASHSAPAAPDRILDFSQRQGDRIVLHGLDGDLDQSGDQPLEFIGRHRFTDAGQVMETVIDGHTVVRINLDDDPRAELRIELHDAIDLHRGDFLL